jgi:hypothetical protein
VTPKHPPGPPMTLGNMRQQGVQHFIRVVLCRQLDTGTKSGPS